MNGFSNHPKGGIAAKYGSSLNLEGNNEEDSDSASKGKESMIPKKLQRQSLMVIKRSGGVSKMQYFVPIH